MSRVDRPRTNPAITNASSALVLVAPVPNSCEANRSVVPAASAAAQSRPRGGLNRSRAVAVAHPGPNVLAAGDAFVAFPPKNAATSPSMARLQQQLSPQPGDLLERASQVTPSSEHLVDLCMQPLHSDTLFATDVGSFLAGTVISTV